MLLPKVIGYLKMNAAKQVNTARGRYGLPMWQRNHYEHIVRSDEDLYRLREYILENPARWSEDEENPSRTPDWPRLP